MNELIKSQGIVTISTVDKSGEIKKQIVRNKILRTGRIALAKTLANDFGSSFDYFINAMSWGNGGTSGGNLRYIDDTTTGFFGTSLLTKATINSINPDTPTQVVFTSVIGFDEINGNVISEAALKLRNLDFYSMVTFGDITKTSSMQLIFDWEISFV